MSSYGQARFPFPCYEEMFRPDESSAALAAAMLRGATHADEPQQWHRASSQSISSSYERYAQASPDGNVGYTFAQPLNCWMYAALPQGGKGTADRLPIFNIL
ncbi:hypothetical protein CERSUDRAFT_87120 [Gelatoporia subvermispora B]|uniref:Uncharacterized protein n=1 Tax=Ceriporiopsis subvermispora (strain B) TaxID=914234 RepID=M2QA52_CERS8|nr:hypothetical protein CERSUDRAFT_87120 [Gelatoporia subvermispora B]